MAGKVLVIGWDAADWKVINPLLESGEMPTLKKFLSEGVYGNISTMDPPLSPMLWTTIATGKMPEQHGILNFIEPDPVLGGVRPVTSLSRKTKAIWNILNQNKYTSNVIGWWPSNPAEPINGIMVSNLFQKSDKTPDAPWPMKQGTVHPENLADTFASLRIHPGELTEQHILPFVPNALSIKDENDAHIATLATMLAETASVQSALTWAMESQPADFTAVYFDGIDHFCHAFMKYHPPRFSEEIPVEQYELYKDVVKGIYKFHDMMLERQLALTDKDTTVIILSDHGFHSDHLRMLKYPKEPAGPTYEHRDYGIFCMKGPGVKKDHQVYGVTLADIAPTLLTVFDLPVGKDMAGKPILSAFENPKAISFVESWDLIEGDTGMHPADMTIDPVEAHEALMQLVQLGYIEDPGENKAKATESCIREIQYNLGRSLMFDKQYKKALPVFESLYKNFEEKRFASNYLNVLLQLKNKLKCRQVLEELKASKGELSPSLRYLEASLLILEQKYYAALELLLELQEKFGYIRGLHIQTGHLLLKLDHYQKAIDAFQKALEYDQENASAFYGLGLCHSKLKNFEDASLNLLNSIELSFYNPLAHYYLGESQVFLGENESAINAFEAAVAISPGMVAARQWLIKLYKEVNDQAMVEKHASFIKVTVDKPVFVVSGLPRSGTSMMMQMLHAGGVDILTDEIRNADQNNPKGYFEYEPVKKLAESSEWLKEQSGKTIKIISHLLPHLQPGLKYKILFMEREMEEVLKSQQIMIAKENKKIQNAYPLALANTFEKQLQQIKNWLERQPNIEVLFLNYAAVIENPQEYASKIKEFTGLALDVSNMITAVDPSLHRNQNPVWI